YQRRNRTFGEHGRGGRTGCGAGSRHGAKRERLELVSSRREGEGGRRGGGARLNFGGKRPATAGRSLAPLGGLVGVRTGRCYRPWIDSTRHRRGGSERLRSRLHEFERQ